jgi:hypothetical protein
MGDRPGRIVAPVAAIVAALALALAAPALANVPLTKVSTDPFTNSTSQHATEVEPDTFAHGSTVVAAFQSGRFFDGGGSDIGYARSTDGGASWDVTSFLPGLTFNAGPFADPSSPFERVSDPSVAYDARHDVWMVSSIPIRPNVTVPNVYVNRSTDGGQTFGDPVKMPAPPGGDLDKNWTACDNHRHSEFYGRCYTEFDDFGNGGRVYMSTSTDGGKTWGPAVTPAGGVFGLGGQPVVLSGGAVVVPFESNSGQIASFRSTDGGASWSSQTSIAGIQFHTVAGNLRTSPLPSAEIDRGRKVYVAWEDCRFEPSCDANDIVFASSSDGLSWSAVKRIPIDPIDSGVDHFIPGLAVDPATRGSGTHLGLTYYYYPDASCSASTCELRVGFISSPDAGGTWSAPTALAGPMSLADIADTSDGSMVGDYISTSFNDAGAAATVFAIGKPHTGEFREGTWAPTSPLPVARASATRPASAAGAAARRGPALVRQTRARR